MAERIEYPPELQGEEEERIRQIHRYLRRLVEQLNSNQDLTDENLSEYISTQTEALRAVSGATGSESGSTDIRDMTAELVRTLEEMIRDLKRTNENTVKRTEFTGLWTERARTTPVTPVGGSTGIILATGVKNLQDWADNTDTAIGTLQSGKAGKYVSTTEETDADELTTPGKYVFVAGSGTLTHFPTGITNGERILLEVEATTNGPVMQRAYSVGMIHTRIYTGQLWQDWFEFNGTQQ